ncbi:MAG TPA: HD domain-containing phosphohydrolase [Burkholderiales bacterium]
MTRAVVLAVDDDTDLLALIAKVLSAEYQVLTASDPRTALELACGEPRPDLILLDVDMPGATGFELIRVLKREGRTALIPVVFLTARTAPQDQTEGFDLGATDYITKPVNSAVLKARVRNQLAAEGRRAELEHRVQSTRAEIIRRLARAMELHESTAVGNRVLRLAQYAKLVSQAAGAEPQICEAMAVASPLHDVGKLGVPAEILRKPEKLSSPDWERVRRHPQIGAEIIGEHDDPLLKLARQISLTHHENWDGTGYPQGLKGDAIPWPGRVMAVVDSFESLTTTQFHRAPRSIAEAAAEIERGAGKRYDPAVVAAFKKALPEMTKVREAYSDALGDLVNLDFAKPRTKK